MLDHFNEGDAIERVTQSIESGNALYVPKVAERRAVASARVFDLGWKYVDAELPRESRLRYE